MSERRKYRKEIRIPVPFGHLTAKTWGHPQSEPVLAIHGLQDNAGTFDALIPLLTSPLYIVCLDLPGHGFSARMPPGAIYHYNEIFILIKYLISHFKWKKFNFLCHSYSGNLALMYCSIFPEDVKNVILIETILYALSTQGRHISDITRQGILNFSNTEAKLSNAAPVYTLEEARARLISSRFDELTQESADILLNRGLIRSKCGKGFVFTRDIRLGSIIELQLMKDSEITEYMKKVKCNVLMIMGSKSVTYKILQKSIYDAEKQFMDLFTENCNIFKIIRVDGNHYVHLNYPQRIAPYIDSFFNENMSMKSSI